jgi:hypothetical protein
MSGFKNVELPSVLPAASVSIRNCEANMSPSLLSSF